MPRFDKAVLLSPRMYSSLPTWLQPYTLNSSADWLSGMQPAAGGSSSAIHADPDQPSQHVTRPHSPNDPPSHRQHSHDYDEHCSISDDAHHQPAKRELLLPHLTHISTVQVCTTPGWYAYLCSPMLLYTHAGCKVADQHQDATGGAQCTTLNKEKDQLLANLKVADVLAVFTCSKCYCVPVLYNAMHATRYPCSQQSSKVILCPMSRSPYLAV